MKIKKFKKRLKKWMPPIYKDINWKNFRKTKSILDSIKEDDF